MNTEAGRMQIFLMVVLVSLALIGGFVAGRRSFPIHPVDEGTKQDSLPGDSTSVSSSKKVQWWTCSMHPQIKLPSGDMKCPICFMDLIPLEETAEGSEEIPELSLSERQQLLAEVEAAPVERREVTKTVRLVGKIQPDETQLAVISARVPGRLDRLFVDYTGMKVRKGDHLVEIYSPELFSAQQELLQSVRTLTSTAVTSSELVKDSNQSLIEASKQKLIRLGLTQEQVEEVLKSGVPQDTVTLYSPTAGVVIRREGTVGMYVGEGTTIYTIADLSTVWLLLDAYESDMEWLHYGQQVVFETEAYPGEQFKGTLSFLSPLLDERSRTLKLRVNVPNPEERLRPGMFVRATIQAVPAGDGRVMAAELAGKWICPMHPEVVQDATGNCPVCGMPLETAESLGYQTASSTSQLPLVIPDTAPLITGKRAVVYVEEKKEDKTFYTGREIELGPHADGYYLVVSGLSEGEQVVTQGNFKIDSALQILARPSMMNPKPAEVSPTLAATATPVPTAPTFTLPVETAVKLKAVVETYLTLQSALAGDAFEDGARTARELARAVEAVGTPTLEGAAKAAWEESYNQIKVSSAGAAQAADIAVLRVQFEPLSIAMDSLVQRFGNVLETPVSRVFCPMAFNDKGAYWLQTGKMVMNPYFGDEMLHCGAFKVTYPPQKAKAEEPR